MTKETDLQKKLAIQYADYGRLWVFDNGLGYHKIGDNYYPFKYGTVGFPDLAGFTEVEITQEMVGKRYPIFTAIEVKLPKGYPTKEQKAFIQMVKSFNGIAGVARCWEDVEEIKKPTN